MWRIAKLLGCLIAFAAVHGCASVSTEPNWQPPTVIPPGWMADYDYASGINKYLRHQYDSARLEGATAYVYVYFDRSWHCRDIRKLMSREPFSPLFRDVRVSMLDYRRLEWLFPRTKGVAFDPGHFAAIFVKITFDGTLSEVFNADLALYHPEMLYQIGYSDPMQPTFAEFAEALHQYFERNAEI